MSVKPLEYNEISPPIGPTVERGSDNFLTKILKTEPFPCTDMYIKDASFFCHVKRTDYTDNPRKILSGVRNDDGNVVGVMVHASLDENPILNNNILNYLDADEKDIQKIKSANQELVKKMKREVGIGLEINSEYPSSKSPNTPKTPPCLMIASTGSDSGKTFLTAGIVGVMRKMGIRVGVLKVGPDIRDLVPSLYLNKEKMEKFSSIQIGGLGWKDLEETITDIQGQGYDLILIEAVMSIFTGLLNEKNLSRRSCKPKLPYFMHAKRRIEMCLMRPIDKCIKWYKNMLSY